MRPIFLVLALLATALFGLPGIAATPDPIRIVAAENFYGDLATQIGGDHVTVTSILANPDADPHLFESSASTARAIDSAAIVIYNGLGYDPWMDKLLAASKQPKRTVIIAAAVTGRKGGDNPHIWYDTATFPALAKALAAELEQRDPANAKVFDANYRKFLASLAPITAKIATLKAAFHDTEVTATEPVFGYMASALGFKMLNDEFQLATMNGTEPSPKSVIAFEKSLTDGSAKLIFYNNQVTDTTTARLLGLAKGHHVAVVGVSETEPAGKTIQTWFLDELQAIEDALKS